MTEMEYSKIVDDVEMLLSLSDEDYYRILLKELGLRDCYILTKNKKVKNRTQFIRKLKLVKIKD